MATITPAEATGKTGSEKRADLIAAVAALVVTDAAKGGVSAVVADAEKFVGLVLEEVLVSVKKTPIVAVGPALLKMLGIGCALGVRPRVGVRGADPTEAERQPRRNT